MKKTIRNKSITVILALALMISFMPKAIHAESVTETADFVTDAAGAIGLLGGASCVEYDTDKNEITLKGVNFSTSANVAVRLPDGVKLVLASATENRIISTYAGEVDSYGIQGSDVTICGEGALEVKGGTLSFTSYGISASSITISGGEVNATGGEAQHSSSGISASSITISGGQVTGRGGKALWDSWGIMAGGIGSYISIYGSSNVTAIGGDAKESLGISASSITISGGELAATGGSKTEFKGTSVAISALDSFEISGGTVTAAGGEAPVSIGIEAKSVTVTDGQLAVTGADTDTRSMGIYSYSSVTISGGTVNATSGMVTDPGGMSNAIAAEGLIKISGGTVTAIGDTQALYSVPELEDYGDYTAVGAKSVIGGVPVSPEPYNTGNNDEYIYFNIKPMAAGPIIYVNEVSKGSASGSSWANASTLQTALEKAKPGNQIWVAKGTYFPTSVNGIVEASVANYDRYKHFQMKNGVAIYGGFAGDEAADYDLSARDFAVNETILSGDIGTQGDDSDNSYHLFFHDYDLALDDTAELDGFTITGGNANYTSWKYKCGGGMFNYESSPTLTNVTFSGNSAGDEGGGMYNEECSPKLTNVILSKNSANYAGGMSNNYSSPTLTNVTFNKNSASRAGGMYNLSSNPILTDVTFSENSALNNGGGMNNVGNSSPTLTDLTFSGNSAGNYGGGIYNDSGWWLDTSMPLLTNVAFIGNSAGNEGGGMYNCGGSFPRIPVLTNTTFSGNSAGTEGGGMYNQDGNSPTITNSIFWGNSNGHIDGPGAADITYSLIQDYTGTGDGNISGDPMFAGAGDFSLNAGSPAIDAGTNEPFEAEGVAYGVTTDLVGKPRIVNNIVDMGAYESQNSIVVKAQPNKLVYTEGETLDLTGLEVTLTYNDGSTADVELADFETNGITANPANGTVMTVAAHNGQPVTLTWGSLTAATDNLTVNAIPSPTIQSAVQGNAYVNITWSSVPGATGYKIYLSTVSGLYGTALETVSNSVYSYEATGLSNGTTYFFVVRTSFGAYESANSNEISATPQVPAPGAPVLLTAVAGDGHVNLTWSEVEGSIGYKIYSSTASGTYTSPADTVAGSVYSCDVTGLTNGTTYYFAAKASNPGGQSAFSNEVSATPRTVPAAPTDVAARAGNGQAAVSFTPPADNGGSAITGYTVTSNPGNITAAGTGTTITVTGLSNGTAYTFTVTASNAAGTGPASAPSNAVTPYRPSSGDSDRETDKDETPPVPVTSSPPANGVDILINGKVETAATATTIQQGDKTVTTVVVDDKKVEERLEQEGNNAVVTIPFNNGADVVVGTLNGQTVKNMENKNAVLEIKTGQVTYTLPASQINIDAVSEQIGEDVELKDIAVSVKISEPAADTVRIVEDTANENNYLIVVEPVEFEITCSRGDKTVAVSKFSAYVERMIEIPEGIDPSKITTGIILNADGTFSHVPTVITVIDGKYYAKINSLTNSVYSVIYSPKTFKDVEKHWAKEAVNDMASRLVVSGVGEDRFEPDRDITRAEFAAIAVRALGLMRPGTGKDIFNDVSKDAWYYDAVSIAYEYDLIAGYGSGQFGPMDKITREQAMTMVARAMKITGLEAGMTDSEVNKALAGFADVNSAADYAKAGIAACVKTGIISGRSKTTLAPKDNITRAEVAVIVQRLLHKSNLI